MRPFQISVAHDPQTAIAAVSNDPQSMYIAGGTTVVDLMKEGVLTPQRLVDIDGLGERAIESAPGGGVRIGALARMSEVARHPLVRERAPAVSQALLLSASAQLRNMASIGGNLMQRTRCVYFRDVATACNKRAPGTGCTALDGINRRHAIVGGSPQCICTHPSDLAVALLALDAAVDVRGLHGTRRIPLREFYLLPGTTPQRETAIAHGELITHVEIPAAPVAAHSVYRKVRDRAAYDFALVSAAAALRIDGGVVRDARLAFGGIAPVPWRSLDAEHSLIGAHAGDAAFRRAAEIALRGATGRKYNAFKIELAKRTAVRALRTAGRLA